MDRYRNIVYGLLLVGGIVLAWLLRSFMDVPVDQPSLPEATTTTATAGPGEVIFGSLVLRVPEGWQAERPSSSMRMGQFRLPAYEGGEDAELAVFSGIGGGTEGNLARWFSQFQQPEGASPPKTWQFSQGNMEVTMADLSGTYLGSGMMTGEKVNLPDYRLLAAIVETSDDTYYFKLVGPHTTVERWAVSFENFIRSVRQVRG